MHVWLFVLCEEKMDQVFPLRAGLVYTFYLFTHFISTSCFICLFLIRVLLTIITSRYVWWSSLIRSWHCPCLFWLFPSCILVVVSVFKESFWNLVWFSSLFPSSSFCLNLGFLRLFFDHATNPCVTFLPPSLCFYGFLGPNWFDCLCIWWNSFLS